MQFRAAGRCQGVQRPLPDFGLDAAAAERAGLGAVGEDEHGRAGLLRRRTAGGDDRAAGARQAPRRSPVRVRRGVRA